MTEYNYKQSDAESFKQLGNGHVIQHGESEINVPPHFPRETCCQRWRRQYVPEKIIHVVTVTSLVFLGLVTFRHPWLVLYFYTATCPPLLCWRIYTYVKAGWHLFLLDFCYFVNIFCLIVIWGIPGSTPVFLVLYGLTSGPLLGATVIFRNSLVFHDVDRVTSAYIHVIAPLCTFLIRWYPADVSKYWYVDFFYDYDGDFSLIWLYAVPIALTFIHMVIYLLIVEVCYKPPDDVWNSYRYLSAKTETWYGKLINIAGERPRFFVYYFLQMLLAAAEISWTWLTYKFYIANCIALGLAFSTIIYNGCTYYMDVFGKPTLARLRQNEGDASKEGERRGDY